MITRGVHLNAFLCFVFPQKRPDVYGLLGQWLIFNFFLITYLVGKISHSNFYFRLPLAKWDGLTILTLTDSTCSRQAFTRAARELVVKHMRTLDLVSWGITGTYQPFRVLGWVNINMAGGLSTLPETKMAPENWWLEDVFPIGNAYFQGLC